ncbi:MAG TPA: DUF2911 domain-containing protein [Polyangia bacterium]|jgi:hypothetical protein|nr:DUF2911 domain-containing protein [Polyangia bacterium]
MKTLLSSLAVAVICIGGVARAQQIELPRPSPFAKVSQTVGLTELTVDYSSPRVNGRKIWGNVVPYGQVWRAGANLSTKLTVSRDVTIGATKVPAGSYALFVIPQKQGNWTFIISKDPVQPGAFAYKAEQDLLRIDVKPQPMAQRERLSYSFDDFAAQNAVSIVLEWEKVRLALPVKLGTDAQVAASLKTAEDTAWAPFNQAARYMLEQKKDYDGGLALVDRSIAIGEVWNNDWTKAQLLAAKGNYKQALPLAQKAEQLGSALPADKFGGKDDVKKALAEWKNK